MGILAKKRKFVRDGVFNAELNEYLKRELAGDGFAGLETRVTPKRTEIVIRATKTKEVLGENGRRIQELTSFVQKRFRYKPGAVQLYVERVVARNLCAMAQCEALKAKLFQGLQIRRAATGLIRSAMEAGAKGCEVLIGGKVKGQRAKTMKYRDGYMIKSGTAHKTFVDHAVRHCHLRAGTIGVQIKIMLPQDPENIRGPSAQLPDVITVLPPKTE